ncbi:D-inositol-3-phosphate glycosyltransferase [subsurface metagenome]
MFLGGERFLLPMLTAKLLRKDVVMVFAGSGVKVAQAEKDSFYRVLRFLSRANCALSDRIILYSERLIEEYGLERYRSKISVATKHFLTLDTFKIQTSLKERDDSVGYIGSLHELKGVPNFLSAIPKVLEKRDDIRFLIGGDGKLRGEVEDYLSREDLGNRASFIGWIPHEQLPKYLNQLKLLVLPSCTEGLPNIILEAMACGTPVLATPVGAIPDVIRDGETGFILEDNSPECIARNIIRVLNHPNLDDIAMNARSLTEREFSYEAAVEKYNKILSNF